jgi:hypothetical protein
LTGISTSSKVYRTRYIRYKNFTWFFVINK